MSPVRSEGLFIAIEVDDAVAADTKAAARLHEVCPVDIFGQSNGGELELQHRNLDECVLCGLCLDAMPDGGVRVIKLYDGGAELR